MRAAISPLLTTLRKYCYPSRQFRRAVHFTMATNGLASSPRIPWRVLQNWVEQKQNYESEHNQPAPLTPDEQKAIVPLLKLLAPARVASPVLDDRNWIGELQERMQKNSLANPSYREEVVPGLLGSPSLFRCYVQATGLPSTVPGPDYGFGSDGTCPSFATKKKAKTYAAQCAIEYLRQKPAASRSKEAPEELQASFHPQPSAPACH